MEYLITGAERTANMKLEPPSYHSKTELLINEVRKIYSSLRRKTVNKIKRQTTESKKIFPSYIPKDITHNKEKEIMH